VDVAQTFIIYSFDESKMKFGRFPEAGFSAEGFRVIGRFTTGALNYTVIIIITIIVTKQRFSATPVVESRWCHVKILFTTL
jgi:hypothetical protein